MERYDWPGNVRELEHLLSRAALKAIREQGRDSPIISIGQHHLSLQETVSDTIAAPVATSLTPVSPAVPDGSLREHVDAFQRELINRKLQQYSGNLAATARALKLDRSNLVRTMARLGIARP